MKNKRAKKLSLTICCALLITTLSNTVESEATDHQIYNSPHVTKGVAEEYRVASDSNAALNASYNAMEYSQNKYKVATNNNADEYIEIWTIQDLMDINSDLEKNYVLMNDLDLGGMEWIPISCRQYGGYYYESSFSGTFDGNNHTISNFTITDVEPRRSINSICNYGFFGIIQGGTIENLTLKNVNFSEIGKGGFVGTSGGLCGSLNGGTIRNCSVYDPTFENMYGGTCGGMVGESHGTISGCAVYGTIENFSGTFIGGIAGIASGAISDCINEININRAPQNLAQWDNNAAGIAGVDGTIKVENCINKGNISTGIGAGIIQILNINSSRAVEVDIVVENCINEGTIEGGFVAGIVDEDSCQCKGTLNILRCANKGTIKISDETIRAAKIGPVRDEMAAGIVSSCTNDYLEELKISQCYNKGTILGSPYHNDGVVAGILGEASIAGDVVIEDCFNAGLIDTGLRTYGGNNGGGIVGGIGSNREKYKISRCYNAGLIIGKDNLFGAIGCEEKLFECINCYYLDNVNTAFIYVEENENVKRLSDQQMQSVSEYKGWNFNDIWIMGMNEYLYPVLRWMTEAPDMPEMGDNDKAIEITDCSGWGGDTLYYTSDIVIKFNKDICINPGENCIDRFEVRVYISDQVLFTWDTDFNDYSIEGNTLTIKNALIGCSEWEGNVLYLHIPDGFFRSAESEEDIVKGYTDKGKFSFLLGLSWEPTLHYVQFKYVKNGEMILYYVQSVKDGALCPAIEGAAWNGYEFVDWYEDEELTKLFDFTIPINRDYTLYGKYVYRQSSNIGSDSDNNTSSGSDSSSSSDSNIFEAKLRDSGFVNMSDGIWMVYKDGKPLTGYQENLYYNGERGSFLFDENGFMLTGWHEVNGQLKYFDEVLGHRGYEIKPSFIADKVRRSSAYESLSKFNYAGTFAKDLNFLDATAFLICDYDDINDIVKRWLITGTNPINANDDWAQKHLKSILKNLLEDENTPKYYSFKKDDENKDGENGNEDSDDNVTDVVIPLLTSAGYETMADLIKYMQDAMGYTEDTVNAMFGSYASNISMLEQYKEICPEMSSAIDSLIHEYQNTVAANLRKSAIDKLVEETNVKNLNELYKELYTAKQGTIEEAKAMRLSSDEIVKTLITTLFVNTLQDNVKDSSSVSNVEDVIYSAYPRNSAMKALSRAEQNLIANPNSYNAQNQYIAAFDFALESTKVQYWAMYEYYLKKGDTGVAQKIYDDYVKLSKMNFMNY